MNTTTNRDGFVKEKCEESDAINAELDAAATASDDENTGPISQQSSIIDDVAEQMSHNLRIGFTQRGDAFISPNGVPFVDMYTTLTESDKKALNNTPFGKMKNLSSIWMDVEKMRPAKWLVDGLIHESIIAMFAGAGAIGKSFLTKLLALSICGGIPFLGKNTGKPRRVLYLDCEDPRSQNQRGIHKILNGLCKRQEQAGTFDSDKDDLPVSVKNEYRKVQRDMFRHAVLHNLVYVNLCDDPAWSHFSPELVDKNGKPTDFFRMLKRVCDVIKPDLIVWDPLVYFLEDESCNISAKKLYNIIKQLGDSSTTHLVAHHVNKSNLNGSSPKTTAEDRQGHARGASHLVFGAKFVAILERAETGGVNLEIAKHNYCENKVDREQIPLYFETFNQHCNEDDQCLGWRLESEVVAEREASRTGEAKWKPKFGGANSDKPEEKPEPPISDIINAGYKAHWQREDRTPLALLNPNDRLSFTPSTREYLWALGRMELNLDPKPLNVKTTTVTNINTKREVAEEAHIQPELPTTDTTVRGGLKWIKR